MTITGANQKLTQLKIFAFYFNSKMGKKKNWKNYQNKILENKYDAFRPLFVAAQKGNLEECKLFLESIEEKNPSGPNGWTPFEIAAQKGHLEVWKLILGIIEDKNP